MTGTSVAHVVNPQSNGRTKQPAMPLYRHNVANTVALADCSSTVASTTTWQPLEMRGSVLLMAKLATSQA